MGWRYLAVRSRLADIRTVYPWILGVFPMVFFRCATRAVVAAPFALACSGYLSAASLVCTVDDGHFGNQACLLMPLLWKR